MNGDGRQSILADNAHFRPTKKQHWYLLHGWSHVYLCCQDLVFFERPESGNPDIIHSYYTKQNNSLSTSLHKEDLKEFKDAARELRKRVKTDKGNQGRRMKSRPTNEWCSPNAKRMAVELFYSWVRINQLALLSGINCHMPSANS